MSYTLIDMANKYLPQSLRVHGQTYIMTREQVESECLLLDEEDAQTLYKGMLDEGGEKVTLRWSRYSADHPNPFNA